MGILDEDVARVREATDIVAVASEHMALRKVGRRYSGLCPFHTEKSPSFTVNPELGLYHCFGCGVGGDAISFVREIEHLDFVGAVERLAGKAGISLRYDDAVVSADRRRRDRLVEATRAAVAFYHEILLSSPEAGTARRYLRSRGYDGDVARRFQLGYAPDTFDALCRHLTDAKFSRQEVLDAGLAFVNRVDRLQDFFRARVMFPIFDVRGDPVAFGGRALDKNGPKYKNSPESVLYQKSRVLYGLNWAKADIVTRGEAVVCEGYTDVLAFFGAGVPRAVATCGTALGEDHLRVLRNFTDKVILAYDADEAGQAASERIYQWEARFEMRLSVADLPAGQDPADIGQTDTDRLAASVTGARPFLQFRLERLLGAADTQTVEGRALAAKAAKAIIGEHPDELVRDQYLMWLGDRLGIDVDQLRRLEAAAPAAAPAPSRPSREDQPPPALPRRPVDRREVEALRVAVQAPELAVDRFVPALFADPVARSAFEALAASATFHEALEAADPEARHVLERLAVEEVPWGESAADSARAVFIQLVEAAAVKRRDALVRAGEMSAAELTRALEGLRAARHDGPWEAADHLAAQLLPWVSETVEE